MLSGGLDHLKINSDPKIDDEPNSCISGMARRV